MKTVLLILCLLATILIGCTEEEQLSNEVRVEAIGTFYTLSVKSNTPDSIVYFHKHAARGTNTFEFTVNLTDELRVYYDCSDSLAVKIYINNKLESDNYFREGEGVYYIKPQ